MRGSAEWWCGRVPNSLRAYHVRGTFGWLNTQEGLTLELGHVQTWRRACASDLCTTREQRQGCLLLVNEENVSSNP